MSTATRGASTARLLAAAFLTLSACQDRVPLGSWEREPGAEGGAPASGGSTSGAAGASGGTSGAGTAGVAGMDGPGEHVCRAPGNPGAFNPPGRELGVTVLYTDWTWPASMESLEWELELETDIREDGYFWTHQFSFVGGARGFLGLQARGGYQAEPPFGPVVTTDMAVFWISSSPLAAELGDVEYPDARAYLQEDSPDRWMTIHARYEWEPCTTYRMRVGRESAEPSGDVWYGAWITDTSTGLESFIGRILVPAAWEELQPSSSMWSNRIGYAPQTSCASAERASAFYAVPTAEGGTMRPTSFVNRFDARLRCPTSRFTEFADGVRHELGVSEP